jgi:hypothetical protein
MMERPRSFNRLLAAFVSEKTGEPAGATQP